jgi:membrane protein implicated in regulation of membrane protease activity
VKLVIFWLFCTIVGVLIFFFTDLAWWQALLIFLGIQLASLWLIGLYTETEKRFGERRA